LRVTSVLSSAVARNPMTLEERSDVGLTEIGKFRIAHW
jgi:hypothetical protein